MQLNARFGQNLQWFVGLGLKSWFVKYSIARNVQEFTWWQIREYKNLRFVFSIAQHWSSRSLFDRNTVKKN